MSHANIAVLGDLHGHLTLAYRLLHRWDREHGERIDCILQVGDLGAYPPPFRLDDATVRFAKKDPDELGFMNYFSRSAEADAILGPNAPEQTRVQADLYFIKGNHEDFEFLAELAHGADGPVSADYYGRIFYLPSGSVVDLAVNGMPLRVGALGGVRPRGEPGSRVASPSYSMKELTRLSATGSLDILLTHDVPRDTVMAGAGSPEVWTLIRRCAPRYHFCGHYHEEGRELDVGGPTRSFLLNEVNFHGSSRLNRRCMGILRWNLDERSTFEFVEDEWLHDYTRANYRGL